MTKKKTLLCATGNPEKFAIGARAFSARDIELEQVFIEIDEIQGEDPEKILRHKAESAFALLQKPVLVSDDSWSIPSLGGFPGAYMKSMNHWFTPEDFLRLMHGVKDRTIYLEQRLAFIDGSDVKTFSKILTGKILEEPRGKSGNAIMKIVELEHDDMTIAELFDNGLAHGHGVDRDAWAKAAEWYSAKEK